MDLNEKYEQFCSDQIECAYDDDGNLIQDVIKDVNATMSVYAKYLEAKSKVEVATINSETELKTAKIKATESSIGGALGFVMDGLKLISNSLNLKSCIWAEESANKIVSQKYMGFIKKQP